MTKRVKLRASLVGQMEGDDLTEDVTAATIQRTIDPSRKPIDVEKELPIEGDVIDGTYRLVSKLGAGMFGSVYVAERTDVPEHRVALKLINRVVFAGRNPERELVMLAAATHPNIVELKDHGITDDLVWLTMPLYDGETLQERLARGPLSLRDAYEIFFPVARGVAALHARGLRHQDIKPENIYLADFAGQIHPVLLDLGVAVEKDAPFVAGTALFGAPEQVAALGSMGDPSVLSEKMDTYCLASTLLYALVGDKHFPGVNAKTPFDIAQAFEVREKSPLHEDALPELTGKPREMLEDAFSRWLVMEPTDRPTVDQLADELEVLLEKEREEARAVQRGIAQQKASLQRFRLITVGVLSVIAAIGFYAYSQRKTLDLAARLQKAKSDLQEAQSERFGALDECRVAYKLSEDELGTCSSGRKSDGEEHGRVLAGLKSSNERDVANLNEKLTTTNTQLQTCEEEQEELSETLTSEKSKWEEERGKLETEKEDEAKARKTCEDTSVKLTEQQATCQKELASCMSDLDIYAAAPAPKPPSGNGPPAPAPVPAPAPAPGGDLYE
jgi:serine/threonine protein kinase